ncbi:Retrovirus-related Pol polyprotein from transposon RE1 [Vitis vinifera]|uniref:Retrovirus-related Pol polyprotein from transposon RE1 n=1 Tax=Vitis vinifera TaxID=29760 RepID=A0A438K4M4_VITVI|nr:Retrovirus-related Pol polyprotein from transposon RE1 [Vitis vinifera]
MFFSGSLNPTRRRVRAHDPLSASSDLRRQLPSLAKTCVCLGKASSSSPVTFLLCLGPDIPGSSSTAVIRPPFRALFDPNVIQSQRPWNSSLWDKVMRIILLHLRMLYLMLTKCNGRKLMHNYEAYYAGHGFVYLYWPDCVYKEEFLTLMPFTNGAEAQQIQTDKFFMVLTLIGLRLDLESVRDQILASPSVPSLDDPLRLTLEEDVVAIGIEDNVLSAPIVISLVTLEIIVISYMDDLLALLSLLSVTWTAHIAQSSNPLLSRPDSATSSTSQSITLTDSGASDHISGNKHLFSSITTISALPTVTLANGSQTIAKGIGLAHPLPSLPLHSDRSTRKTIGIGHESQGLYHLTSPSSPIACISTDAPLLIHSRLGHPSLSKFQKMVPRFSTLSSLACESYQLGKHTRVSFPKRLNNRAKSHFKLVHTDDKLFAKATKCIFLGYSRLQKGYRCYSLDTHHYFLSADVTFFENSPFFSSSESLPISEVLPLPYISLPLDALSHPLQSTSEALSHPGWRQAMVDEMTTLHSNGTWDLVSLPLGKSTVGCRWVYTVKVGLDGQVDHLKARLVAKGYAQIYGCDYGDTFSPVAKIASVHLFLSMATMCHWPLYQLDIKNVFLHGELLEEVYMEQPPVVQEFGMLRSEADHSVFYHHNSLSQCIYLVVYVDDIVITGSDQEGIQIIKQHLFNHFQTKDLGKLKYFLGLEIAQSSSGVVMSQRKYVFDILEETGGASKRSWEISTTCRQIELPHHHLTRHLFSYASWAGSPSDRLSTSGHCVFIRGNLISWKSKKQDVVARSSTEAEYRAMALATCELIWLRQLLQELRFGKDKQIKLVCDNQAALYIASNPVFHERTKHIEVDCHFIREKIASGCVATSFVNSNDQLADIFTKSVRGPRIKYICNKLGAYDIYAPA